MTQHSRDPPHFFVLTHFLLSFSSHPSTQLSSALPFSILIDSSSLVLSIFFLRTRFPFILFYNLLFHFHFAVIIVLHYDLLSLLSSLQILFSEVFLIVQLSNRPRALFFIHLTLMKTAEHGGVTTTLTASELTWHVWIKYSADLLLAMAAEREITPPPLIYSLFILRRLLRECDVNVHTGCLNCRPQVSHFNREVQGRASRSLH